MGPARAMGTFLRTWRSEWARLSRAQLAVGLSALCGKRKTVTADIVREWEDGQPPKSTAELDAVTEVMRRHGLSAPELEQFRQAVFAVCAARQYPELFADDGLAHRADIEEVAYGIWQRHPQRPGAINIVSLVAAIGELDGALKVGLRPTYRGSPARKQAVALAYLRAALVKRHGLSNRFAQVIRATEANAQLLDSHFGPGGLGEDRYLCGLGQRLMSEERAVGRRPGSFGRLMELAREAAQRGREDAARHAIFSAMECLGDEPDVTIDAVRVHWERTLGTPFSLAGAVDDDPWSRRHLFRACLHAGELETAEDHLLALDAWRDDTQVRGCVWRMSAGELAMRAGRLDEAQNHLGKARRIAEEGGFVRAAESTQARLARCEGMADGARPARSGVATA